MFLLDIRFKLTIYISDSLTKDGKKIRCTTQNRIPPYQTEQEKHQKYYKSTSRASEAAPIRVLKYLKSREMAKIPEPHSASKWIYPSQYDIGGILTGRIRNWPPVTGGSAW